SVCRRLNFVEVRADITGGFCVFKRMANSTCRGGSRLKKYLALLEHGFINICGQSGCGERQGTARAQDNCKVLHSNGSFYRLMQRVWSQLRDCNLDAVIAPAVIEITAVVFPPLFRLCFTVFAGGAAD